MSSECRLNNNDRPVAFVTGSAAPRLGRAIAEQFGRASYRLVIHAHHSVSEGQALVQRFAESNIDAMLVQGAVEEESNVARWIDEIHNRFGRLDVLVHSSAIWEPKTLEDTKAADVRHFFEVNLLGSFLCAQHAGLYMVKQASGGSIVLIGDWAIERPYRDFAAYFVSKGAIPTLTRTMAVELASRNPRIRVNSILPGPVMLYEGASNELDQKIREQSLLRRSGSHQDVAEAAYFLTQQAFMTGVSLPVDGGRSIYAPTDQEAIAHPNVSK